MCFGPTAIAHPEAVRTVGPQRGPPDQGDRTDQKQVEEEVADRETDPSRTGLLAGEQTKATEAEAGEKQAGDHRCEEDPVSAGKPREEDHGEESAGGGLISLFHSVP